MNSQGKKKVQQSGGLGQSGSEVAPTTSAKGCVVALRPYQYVHILDLNSSITRLEVGPKSFVTHDHEKVVNGPNNMIILPPMHYCEIKDPVVLDINNNVTYLNNNVIKLQLGETEYRLSHVWKEPFPLYPGETLINDIKPLEIIQQGQALRLCALRSCKIPTANTDLLLLSNNNNNNNNNNNTNTRGLSGASVYVESGHEWMILGPSTYFPTKQVEIVARVCAQIIKPGQALCVRASRALIDKYGAKREAGETWLVRTPGEYMTLTWETVVGLVDAYTITETRALHMKAKTTFVDVYGKKRLAGHEWLLTLSNTKTHTHTHTHTHKWYYKF
eukprot:GHVR01053842.1.p1 GENE.GHVR01053842.1~~GHVR01053842.1.p1  ORF type:complete len:331 (+),score=115.12 GHVR01053842.1:62-1054(+)